MKKTLWTVGAALLVLGAGMTALGGKDVPAETDRTQAAGAAARAVSRSIDQHIDAKLAAAKVVPAPSADDAEFLRRVYLDLCGVIPRAGEVQAFLDNQDAEKRAKVIDELLASPRYGRHMADIWEKLLMIRDSTNRRLQSEPLFEWLAQRFNNDTPWDRMVGDLITATGTQEENGAATFFIALRTPEKLNDQVCRLFLGVQLQCAQCHNHPFTTWKRNDYWSMAAFFSKVRAGGKAVGKGAPEVVNEKGLGKKAPPPDSALTLPPKFLGGEQPVLKEGEPYRPVLAGWLVAPGNPYFSRAMVNRTWAHFFGRGLVNPVDNISDVSAVSHPELFNAMAEEFAAGGFGVKQLMRGICNSQAYQRASGPAGAGETDLAEAGYDRMAVKPMSPEQLYDSLATVLGTLDEARENRPRAPGKAAPPSVRARFVNFFQAPDGADAAEYNTGIPQVLKLMNSPQMNKPGALLDELVKSGRTPAQNVEQLYLKTLSRKPTAEETARLVTFLAQDAAAVTVDAYADCLWVLLNCSEFVLNH